MTTARFTEQQLAAAGRGLVESLASAALRNVPDRAPGCDEPGCRADFQSCICTANQPDPEQGDRTMSTDTTMLPLGERAALALAERDERTRDELAAMERADQAALEGARLLGNDFIRPILGAVPADGWTIEYVEVDGGEYRYPRLVATIDGIHIALALLQFHSCGKPAYEPRGEPAVILRCEQGHLTEKGFTDLTGLGYWLAWWAGPDHYCDPCRAAERRAELETTADEAYAEAPEEALHTAERLMLLLVELIDERIKRGWAPF